MEDTTYYFHIKDLKHQKYLVAGEVYDNNVYHQDNCDRDCAKWSFELIEPKATDNSTLSLYRIRNKEHSSKYLIAGDIANNHIYLQDHNNRANAEWIINFGRTLTGHGGFRITDNLHKLNVSAGYFYDGNIYHQFDSIESISMEKFWTIEAADINMPKDKYPGFYILPNTI